MDDETGRNDEVKQFQRLWEVRIQPGNERIAQIQVVERPRGEMLTKGAEALSILDLMDVLLGKGTRSCDVFSLAALVLKALDQDVSRPNVEDRR